MNALIEDLLTLAREGDRVGKRNRKSLNWPITIGRTPRRPTRPSYVNRLEDPSQTRSARPTPREPDPEQRVRRVEILQSVFAIRRDERSRFRLTRMSYKSSYTNGVESHLSLDTDCVDTAVSLTGYSGSRARWRARILHGVTPQLSWMAHSIQPVRVLRLQVARRYRLVDPAICHR